MAKASDFKKAVAAVQSEIDTLRGEISTLKAERDDLQNGALSADEALAHLAQVIDGHANKHLDSMQGQLAQITTGDSADLDPFIGMDEFGRPRNSAIGLICLLLADDMKTKLGEIIKAQPGLSSISGAERTQRLKAIEARLLELERNEENLICEAEVAGLDIPRRPDANPAVVLEVAV